jgi:hypothetical protein
MRRILIHQEPWNTAWILCLQDPVVTVKIERNQYGWKHNLFQTLGIVPSSDLEDEEEAGRIVDLRGPDPVRPTPEAYDALAGRLAEKVCWLSPKDMSKT